MTDPSTPVPSDEAVEAAADDLLGRNDDGRGYYATSQIISNPAIAKTAAQRALTAAYAIDAPRIAAEAAAEARAATLREVEAWIVNDAKWMDTRAERERWAREIAAHFNPEANDA